jgi:uncharacterized membrane protein YfcA
MLIDPLAFLFAGLIVLVAYIIFGMSGFGSTIIAVPLLAHLYPLKFVIPLIVVLDCIGAIGMGLRLRADVNRRELVPLLPFLLIGLGIGAALLLRLPAAALLTCLGVFAIVFGLRYMSPAATTFRLPRWSAGPLGVFAGTTSSTLGVGGPIYVLYLTGRGATPEQIRATMPVIFTFTTIARIVIFAAAGLFSRDVLVLAAMLLPIMLFGMYCGHRLHLNLSREQMFRVVGGLLVMSGASLLVRAVVSA